MTLSAQYSEQFLDKLLRIFYGILKKSPDCSPLLNLVRKIKESKVFGDHLISIPLNENSTCKEHYES